MPNGDALNAARAAFDRNSWREAYDGFARADGDRLLTLNDLEKFALAAYLVGDDASARDAWTRAHHESLRLDDPPRAARTALKLAAGLVFRGEMAPAMGWIGRAARVLDDASTDSAERAGVLTMSALPVMYGGDPAGAEASFLEAVEIARRHRANEPLTMALLGLGQSRIMQGHVSEGFALLDEAMVAVTSGEVSPLYVGICYCAVIDACHSAFDLRRAREWTVALTHWCDAQPDLVPYRGNCLVHRCEIMRLQGAWPEALDAAEKARASLSEPKAWPALGAACYQLGELHRLRGDFDEAEDAYRNGAEHGHRPEPGLALLHLAQGRVDAAAAAIRIALDQSPEPSERTGVLAALVEISLAADDVRSAREAADELEGMARTVDTPYLHAVASLAAGAVLLAEGDPSSALTRLRESATAWRDLEAPYEVAQTQALAAQACRALGDENTAAMELAVARATYERLGALPDLRRLADPADATPHGRLTPRELEVLALVASGMTNRGIAEKLVLSERTVHRHVSNIFTKLGVASRSGATAYAYEHGLV